MKAVLGPGVEAAIADEAVASEDGLETGGILLGHDRGTEIVITVAGGPGPNARRQPTRFLRDLDHARGLGDQAYEQDQSVWIGEWHTHPRGLRVPSRTDLITYSSLLSDDELGFDRFLSLIVTGCAVHGWSELFLDGWLCDGGGARKIAVETAVAPTAESATPDEAPARQTPPGPAHPTAKEQP